MRLFGLLTLTGLFALTLSAAAFKFSQDELQNILQQPFAAFQADDWWSRAEALGGQLKLWTDQELANAAKVAGDKVDAFKACVADVASKAFDTILVQMRESFPSPENAHSHNERKELVHRALEMAKEKIVGVLKDRTSIDEDTLRKDVEGICFAVENMVVLGGAFALNLRWTAGIQILFIILSMLLGALIPGSFLLRPLLYLFGFGPLGPIRGSAAAWAQRAFWGAAVTKGSWFAVLQQAGMTGIGWLSRPLGALLGGMVTAGNAWRFFGGREGYSNATAGGDC